MPYGPVDHYQIRWRPDDSDGEWIQRNYSVDSSKFSIGYLEKGKDYVIQARSVGPTGLVSIWVDISHTVAGNHPLETPSSLVATGSADSVRLTWSINAVLGAGAMFCVERGTSSIGPWTEITRVTAMYVLLTEKVDGTFYYRVRMTNYDGEFSGYSNVASGDPVTTAEIKQELADISSDNVLTPVEKKIVIRDYNWFIPEQSDLDGQAVLFGVTTEKTDYDNAMSALTSYMATLTTPTMWNSMSGNTTVVGATFRTKWNDMLTYRAKLITKLFSVGKALISVAQTAADAAEADATAALNQLVNYSSDSKLAPAEKLTIVRNLATINGEQAGIDAKATSFAITTEKTAYDAAVTNLNSYLATLTSPVLWSDKSDFTTIVAATFNQKFLDVYNAKQALLNKIYQVAKDIADGKINTYYQSTQPYSSGGTVGDLWTNDDTGVTSRWTGSAWVFSAMYIPAGSGANLIPNGSFQLNSRNVPNGAYTTVGKQLYDGWKVTSIAGVGSYVNPVNNIVQCNVANPTIAAGAYAASQLGLISSFAIEPNASYVMSFECTQAFNGTLGTGIVPRSRMIVQWFNSTGASTGSLQTLERLRGGAAPSPKTIVAPSDARSATIFIDTFVENTSGSAVVATSGSTALQTTFRWVALNRRADSEIPGSGVTVGDTRNLPQIAVGNGIAKVPTVITWSAGLTTATISVAAFTILSGSVSVSYGAKSVGVSKGAGPTSQGYFLYLDDPTYSGTGTLVATTTGDTVYQNDGRVYIGSCTVTYGSGTSGGGDSGGGKGIGSCV